jgi:phosphatidylinositol-3-phosphatase
MQFRAFLWQVYSAERINRPRFRERSETMRAAKPNGIRTIVPVTLLILFFVFVQQSGAQVPAADHVILLMLENHSYSQVVGNTNAPYLNSLIKSYGLATNYDANSHYSIPNYFWLTAGAYVTTLDTTQAVFDVDNITRYLLAVGKTWKAYEESIPYAGYTGPTVEPYEKNHNPFAYFSDVVNSSAKMNMVPFTQLATDIANNQLPNYALITPNSSHDGHNTNLSTVDQWLTTNLAPLLASPYFQPGGNGLLIITFDESLDSDCAPLATCPALPENGGGGHVATIVVGPNVKQGFRSSTFYQHPSTLKTMLLALGISSAPGAGQNARPISDFFISGTTAGCVGTGANRTVTICTPSNGQTLSSPVHVTAAATDTLPVKYSQIYVDGVKVYEVMAPSVDVSLTMSAGTHRLTVQDNDGTYFKSTIYVTVQ